MRIFLVLISASALASGPDVLDFALPGEGLAVVWHRSDVARSMVDEVARRLGGGPVIDGVVERLRAETVAGSRPYAGVWREGVSPERGVGIFVTPEAARVVVGGDDPVAVAETVAAVASAFAGGAKPTGKPVVTIAGHELACAVRAPFVVCETGPDLGSARPAWTTGAPEPARGEPYFLAHLDGRELKSSGFAKAAWLVVAEGEASLRVEFNELVRPTLAMFQAAPGKVPSLGAIDEISGWAYKLSYDPDKLWAGLRQIFPPLNALPPPMAARFDTLETHWSGDLTLGDDGSLAHLVFAVGLRTGGDGEALVGLLVDILRDAGAEADRVDGPRPGLRSLQIAFMSGPERLTLRLPYAQIGEALVFATSPADLKRRLDGGHTPLEVPDAFAARGRHGLFVRGGFGGWAIPWAHELFEFAATGQRFADLQAFLGAAARLIDWSSVTIGPAPDGLELNLVWRWL